jgi:hypothetical protein
MPAPIAYIAEVRVSPRVGAKLQARNISIAEVREAAVLTTVERSRWHFDPSPSRGWRVFLTGSTYQGRRLNIVLYPVDMANGTWNLGTAMIAL